MIRESLSFFNYFAQLLKSNYPDEMTVSEFRSVMLEVLQNGGIDEISSIYHLDRLFDRLSSNRCSIHSSSVVSQDVNTSYVSEEDLSYQDLKELNEVKVPVNVLLMAILHMVHGDNDDRVKAIFRLFKE